MNNQLILGIHDGNDSGVALLDGSGKIIFALNEERLTHKKLFTGFPKKSASYLFRFFSSSSISQIVLSADGLFGTSFHREFFLEKYRLHMFSSLFFILRFLRFCIYFFEKYIYRIGYSFFVRFFRQHGHYTHKIVDHHYSHAAAAYYTSGFQSGLVITMDGYGDGASTTVNVASGSDLKRIATFGWGKSVGQAYSRITQYYGFIPHKHEGKITGLAAYGNSKKCYHVFENLISCKNGVVVIDKMFLIGFNKKKLGLLFGSYAREDVAAALQKRCEDVLTKFVSFWIKKTKKYNLCLSGGVFANVKINQALSDLKHVHNIFIFPHMSDGGLSVGAALAEISPLPFALNHVYFGLEFSDKQILLFLQKNKLIRFKRYSYIEKKIAVLLSKGKVVARFNGKMEYGPRALGNRSILYQTTDSTVNEWLNKKLKRTEFMPFAPSTLDEDFERCYLRTKKSYLTSKFMNIAYSCTSFMKKVSPAVVHLDGTARPQRVCKEDNPSYYAILYEYKKITGIPSLLNTSFNMHEEPIVCTPSDALRAFLVSDLDYLAIGSFLVTKI